MRDVLAAPCPQCGKPAPVSLAHTDELRCASCGFRGRPTPEVAEELMMASSALAPLDARHRQLTESQKRAVTGILWRLFRRRLLRGLAAVRPMSAGLPPGCRVCGEDLAPYADAVARCHYCAADNLVSPTAMDLAARDRVFSNFAGAVVMSASLPGRR